jgi:hypothetical protein
MEIFKGILPKRSRKKERKEYLPPILAYILKPSSIGDTPNYVEPTI